VLIDFDYCMVTLSSLNCHATTALADVGTAKVRCVARVLQAIALFVQVDSRVELWRGGSDGAELLQGADWVVECGKLAQCRTDAHTNCRLIRAARQRLCAILSRSERSSQPTPPSSDPSSAESDAEDDPSAPSAASSAREYSIPVVYSSEVPSDDVTLLPLANSELAKGSVDELAPLCDFPVHILPVLGLISAHFGLHIATYALCELAGGPIERPLPVRHRKKLYKRMWKDLLHRDSHVVGKQISYICLSPSFGARAPPAN
ncbi:hypothetical protein BGW80DRAFT_1170665, partial [Lactifluus volemus]